LAGAAQHPPFQLSYERSGWGRLAQRCQSVGSAEQEMVEPGFCTVGLMADAMKMRVRTYDVAGKPANRPFHLACFRD
jgi:hypothetical protein